MPLEFEWDEKKNRANRARHGISFKEASAIFDGPVFTALDEREVTVKSGSSALANFSTRLPSSSFTRTDAGESG